MNSGAQGMIARVLIGMCCIVLLAGTARASVPPTGPDIGPGETRCQPGRLDIGGSAGDCALDVADDAYLGARLLVARFGNDAVAFADRVADRYAKARDAASAALWRRISTLAAILARHP